jgi:iron(III) transport system permease protein
MPIRSRHAGAYLYLAIVALIVMVPLSVLAGIALGNGSDDILRLVATVLPHSSLITVELLILVALLTSAIGVSTAWLVSEFKFPGHRFLSFALVLPMAIPTYIGAYTFVEYFHFTGPIQSAVRALAGFRSAREYWFPNIRSLGGAALVMSLVLYPYVYLAARVSFLMQSDHAADVARSLGASPGRVLYKITLPMARPAIAAGVSLSLMEVLNDLGAVEYLGVRTLTFSVYNTWLAQGSLGGAAQLACTILVIVFILLRIERRARRKQRFYGGRHAGAHAGSRGTRLSGWKSALAVAICALPVIAGFGIPLWVLGGFALSRMDQIVEPGLYAALANSVSVGAITSTITVLLSIGLLRAGQLAKNRAASVLIRIASIGYCLPGTVLGLGLLFSLAAIDNRLDAFLRASFDISSGLLFTGSAFGVILALTIRFMTLSESTLQSGIEKIPANLEHAARNLGQTAWSAARRVTLPMLRPSILVAFVLVFVDSLKELSATILLRPIGFSTLSTYVYENASRAAVEEGAVAALVIVFAGLVPVMYLSRALTISQAVGATTKKMAPDKPTPI